MKGLMSEDKYMVIDIETTGVDWARCSIIGIGHYSKEGGMIGFSKEIPDLSGYQTIMHNGSYDVKVARKAGIEIPYHHDTILMASLLQFAVNIKESYRGMYDDNRKRKDSLALDNLAIRDLGLKASWKIDWKKDTPTYDEIKEHCLMDCRVPYHLFLQYKEKLIEHNLWNYYEKLLMPMARLLVDVECRGIRLDVDKLLTMKIVYKERIDRWLTDFHVNNKEALDIVIKYVKEDKMKKCKPGKKAETLENRKQKVRDTVITFNPRSTVHMTKLLELKGINLVDNTGKKTTASKLLYRYRHDEIIGQICEYKKINKVYRDFLCKWDDLRVNDILFTNFRLWATDTGRLSSAEPNLQQVPKESDIRELFIPREGYVFTVADAKQLEARLAAYFSKEEVLLEAFRNGIDVYGQIAIDLMGLTCTANEVKELHPKERQIGKQLFLATLYGQGVKSLYFKLSREYEVDITHDECAQYKRIFNRAYPNLKEFDNKCKENADRDGYITTWFGRKNFIEKGKGYKGLNSYTQGSGSDMIGFSQLNIVPNLPKDAHLILMVHDEVIYEHKPEDTQFISDLIDKYLVQPLREKYGIPMDMDIKVGKNWGIK